MDVSKLDHFCLARPLAPFCGELLSCVIFLHTQLAGVAYIPSGESMYYIWVWFWWTGFCVGRMELSWVESTRGCTDTSMIFSSSFITTTTEINSLYFDSQSARPLPPFCMQNFSFSFLETERPFGFEQLWVFCTALRSLTRWHKAHISCDRTRHLDT